MEEQECEDDKGEKKKTSSWRCYGSPRAMTKTARSQRSAGYVADRVY